MYHWQDLALTIIFIVLNISLVPSVISKDKPAITTSIMTIVCLIVAVVVYFSLTLWFAAAMTIVNIALWTTLATQKILQKKHSKKA